MIVVADTSPLCYLVRIGCIEVLPKLFGRVLIPPQVELELLHAKAPSSVRVLIASRPSWLEIRVPTGLEPIPNLDPGEEAAINLAIQEKADLVLIDEKAGRAAALGWNLTVTGTLGVLKQAALQGYLDFGQAVQTLLAAGFHISPLLAKEILDR